MGLCPPNAIEGLCKKNGLEIRDKKSVKFGRKSMKRNVDLQIYGTDVIEEVAQKSSVIIYEIVRKKDSD